MMFDSRDNLQVSGVRSSRDALFFRGYGKADSNTTITDRTYIITSQKESYSLLRTIEDEITAIEALSDGTFVAVGACGKIYAFQRGAWTDRNFEIEPVEILSRSIIHEGNVYIIGTGRTFLKLSQDGWTPVCPALSEDDSVDLYGLCHYQGDEFVVCGEDGFLAAVSTGGFLTLDIPTDLNLNNVARIGEGRIAVCGNKGLLFVGNGDRWIDYSRPDLGVDFTSVLFWRNDLYVSAKDGVLKLGADGPAPFSRVQSFNLIGLREGMWSIGINNVQKYDGNAWTEQRIAFDAP